MMTLIRHVPVGGLPIGPYTHSKKTGILVSLIVPIYNEVENITFLHRRFSAIAASIPERMEVIYVNDGSTDGSQEALEDLHVNLYDARLLNLSRNFGKEAAVQAGFDHCRGDVAVQLDADLQDPPELLQQMLEAYYQGADIVNMRRSKRHGENTFKLFTASLFHRISNKIADVPMPIDVGDFRLLSRRVIDHINKLPERNRYMKGIMSWPGFHQVTIEFDRPARLNGTTKWSPLQLMSLGLSGIISISNVPLKLAFWLAMPILAIALALSSFFMVQILFYHDSPSNLLVMLCVQMWLGGGQLLAVGIVGEYIGRVLIESRQRPLYLIMDDLDLSAGQNQPFLRKLG